VSDKPLRDRIKDFRRVKASELRANPANFRRHPEAQRRVLAGVLEEIGYADALLCREDGDGLTILDGHLRAEITPDQEVPVLVLDVTKEEGDRLMLHLDPLAAMARVDVEAMNKLIEQSGEMATELLATLAAMPEWVEPVEVVPPEEFPEFDEDIETEHKCPKCGYEWSGKINP
jgi:hypothetical protein